MRVIGIDDQQVGEKKQEIDSRDRMIHSGKWRW